MAGFDPRILTVELQFEDNSLIYGDPLYIKVQGSKTIASLQNTATITIGNLRKDHRDYILTNCNQVLQSQYKIRKVRVMAGRKSVGSWLVFEGDIISASVTQPPDIMLILRCATMARDKSQFWTYVNTGTISLQQIAQDFADFVGFSLLIDPAVNASQTVPKFTFNGQPVAMMTRISELFNVKCYTNDNQIVIKPWSEPLSNQIVEVSTTSGMVGIPEFTEYGVKVKTLVDRNVVLGGAMRLTSTMVPVMNADYVITRIDYDLATREQQFYYDLWASRSG
jgi:hypothetical protein